MNVKLIAYTQPADKSMSDEDLIVYCARVSNPENQTNFDSAERLLRYLLRKSHWSPFEQIDLTFEIETTRDIGRQILRHKSICFQEFSQRYAEAEDDIQIRECRMQDTKNRQSSWIEGRDEEIAGLGITINQWWQSIQIHLFGKAKDEYKKALDLGIAKEQARAILPEGLTKTRMYCKASLRSWFHYCLVRCHPGTQKEHRDIGNEVWNILGSRYKFIKEIDITKLSILYQEMFEKVIEDARI